MDDRSRHPPPIAYMQQQRAALQWHREHQLHLGLQRQQEPTRASLVVHGGGQTATTRTLGDQPASSPTVSTPATIIAALPHFLQTLRRDIHARCDHLELQLGQSANNPAPQTPPPIQDDYKAVFAAALVSIHEKLNKIENDLIDVQFVRMLSGSQGEASTSVGASPVWPTAASALHFLLAPVHPLPPLSFDRRFPPSTTAYHGSAKRHEEEVERPGSVQGS
ncbi:hypothetical protein PHLGIDRAFT_10221 [Phlebiopsis gigantea 11061_1 CR5-6]|uniref:Uncharacterized protein n=1 Tax=Phlebiopsis gigantea (strain 11061_1 CR5-6) TaxID=745531 RepID=A0A0C3SFI5_PHLG1|nr:hypothetical protein PHLGIDRAFT_10221 [Phlebiopsis gigantea 11061_1 CR5-6]